MNVFISVHSIWVESVNKYCMMVVYYLNRRYTKEHYSSDFVVSLSSISFGPIEYIYIDYVWLTLGILHHLWIYNWFETIYHVLYMILINFKTCADGKINNIQLVHIGIPIQKIKTKSKVDVINQEFESSITSTLSNPYRPFQTS